jgi:hypothetical protein
MVHLHHLLSSNSPPTRDLVLLGDGIVIGAAAVVVGGGVWAFSIVTYCHQRRDLMEKRRELTTQKFRRWCMVYGRGRCGEGVRKYFVNINHDKRI